MLGALNPGVKQVKMLPSLQALRSGSPHGAYGYSVQVPTKFSATAEFDLVFEGLNRTGIIE
jgi:hypothetical protein